MKLSIFKFSEIFQRTMRDEDAKSYIPTPDENRYLIYLVILFFSLLFAMFNTLFAVAVITVPLYLLFFNIASFTGSGPSMITGIAGLLWHATLLFSVLIWVKFGNINQTVYKLEKCDFRFQHKRAIIATILDGLLSLTIIWAIFAWVMYILKWGEYFSYLYFNRRSNGKFSELMKSELKVIEEEEAKRKERPPAHEGITHKVKTMFWSIF